MSYRVRVSALGESLVNGRSCVTGQGLCTTCSARLSEVAWTITYGGDGYRYLFISFVVAKVHAGSAKVHYGSAMTPL